MGHLRFFFVFSSLLTSLGVGQVLNFTKGCGQNLANNPPTIQVASNDHPGVLRTAKDLALDFGRVTGNNGTLSKNDTIGNETTIIIGTVGSSKLVDELIKDKKLNVSSIEGQWESYIQQVVENPSDGVSRALVIAGSDKRGTIYGTYDISESIGVSPWYWWADVPSKNRTVIRLVPGSKKIQGPPSVKYRGIFINDEWQLISWAKGRFPQSSRGGYFTGDFFKLVFELMLRLKSNYLWPGMKNKAAFYLDDPDNGDIANEFGILMGTSHHEPMARSYNEQLTLLSGEWDWSENQKNITEFMRVGANRSAGWETVYTLGMRGVDDSANPTLTAPQLEEIIRVQQELIKNETGKDLEDVPQAWVQYKEVGQYWQAGMNVSDLVTLLFTDDNYGNLLRVPLANETERRGGFGVYYHFGYVGVPRDYEWMNTIQLVKTWEQMHFAYHREVRKIWIANIQDLKAFEVPMNHFLDMAYDMSAFESPDSTTEWLKRWAEREFGSGVRDVTAEIFNIYGRLILRRKYETLTMEPFAFSTLAYDEAAKVLGEWNDLVVLATDAYNSLPDDVKDAYYERVLYTIRAGRNVFEIYIKKHLGDLYQSQKRTSTNNFAADTFDAFARDSAETSRYHALLDGKWNHIMDNKHIGYTTWTPPSKNTMPNISYYGDDDKPTSGEIGIAVAGTQKSTPGNGILKVHSMSNYMAPADIRYIDVFTRANGTFKYQLQPNVSYVTITNSSGTLTSPGNASDVRSVISVDWDAAPDGLSSATFTLTQGDSDPVDVAHISLNKDTVPGNFTGFVQAGVVLSMEPTNYSRITQGEDNSTYTEIPFYGRTSSGIKLWPVTISPRTTDTGPKVSYDFYAFTTKEKAKLIVHVAGSLNHDPTAPLSLAHALDDEQPVTTRVLKDYRAGTTPTAQGWDRAVITGGWNITTEMDVSEGAHSLNLWLLQPGVVIQKIIIDLGGLQTSALGPPESYRIA